MTDACNDSRTANLLGALVLAAGDRLGRVVSESTGRPVGDTAALVILTTTLDGASQDRLGMALGLSQTGVVRLVDRLAASGHVVRRPGPDARTRALATTPAGRAAALEALASRQESMLDVLSALTPEEGEQLTALLEKLLGHATTTRQDSLRICRLCDTAACGHEEGRCPVTCAAARIPI